MARYWDIKSHLSAEQADIAQGRKEPAQRPVISQAMLRIVSIGILIITVLATIYGLYAGREILLPIALAIVLKLLLQPVMTLLRDRLRLPGALSALLLVFAVFGTIAVVGFSLSVPAAGWVQKAPQSLPVLKEKLAILRQPIDFLQHGLKEVETITTPSDPTAGGEKAVTVTQGGSLTRGLAASAATVLSGLFTTIVILFFLLVSGDRLLRGFVEVLPRFKDKRTAVEIAAEIEESISRYLVTITIMNALVGIATGIAMKLCGLGDPILWGVMAFLLNYIPVLGPMTGVLIFFVAGLVSFEWPWYAFIPAGVYLLIHVAEGETITPMLLAERFTLNPVLVIVSLFFWDAIWGIPGALLAVPLLAIIKIIADRVEPLQPVGHLIGS